ncbi:YrhC family protein [Thalassobacillus hwangdonensis]|uniref:YrhC family protein n=1 Tax=Thalassobacillus hwangdonensis TaxID=546108 RepID=A0ABW3L040_9BACI
MMNPVKELKGKIDDFKRFIMTLLILSSYLFIGTLISMYEYKNGLEGLMMALTVTGLGVAFYFTLKVSRFQKQLYELDEKAGE